MKPLPILNTTATPIVTSDGCHIIVNHDKDFPTHRDNGEPILLGDYTIDRETYLRDGIERMDVWKFVGTEIQPGWEGWESVSLDGTKLTLTYTEHIDFVAAIYEHDKALYEVIINHFGAPRP